jgi:hypothetical protein
LNSFRKELSWIYNIWFRNGTVGSGIWKISTEDYSKAPHCLGRRFGTPPCSPPNNPETNSIINLFSNISFWFFVFSQLRNTLIRIIRNFFWIWYLYLFYNFSYVIYFIFWFCKHKRFLFNLYTLYLRIQFFIIGLFLNLFFHIFTLLIQI